MQANSISKVNMLTGLADTGKGQRSNWRVSPSNWADFLSKYSCDKLMGVAEGEKEKQAGGSAGGSIPGP